MAVALEMLEAQEWPESLQSPAADLAEFFESRIALAQDVEEAPEAGVSRPEPDEIAQAKQQFSEVLGVPLEPPGH